MPVKANFLRNLKMSYDYNHELGRRNRIVEPAQLIAAEDIFHPHSSQKHMLGCILDMNDGRRFRYCENGGTELAVALVNQSAVGTANWQNQAQTNGSAWSVGDKTVTVVLATTGAAHQFAEGYLTTEDGTGEGYMYLIKDNKVGTDNATSGYDISIDIADVGGIRVATATTSEVTVTLNKYKDVVVFPTDPTGVCVGVNLVTVSANYFFWAQTRGPCPVKTDGTDDIVVGDMVAVGANTAGQCCLMDIQAEGDRLIGYVMRDAAHAGSETALIDLCIE